MIGIIILILFAIGVALYAERQQKIREYKLPDNARNLLNANVAFYRELDKNGKAAFEERVRDFLARVTITGVGVEVEDLDRLLVASGAIIPIFAFPDWRYRNISEVLLYDGTFNREFKTDSNDRDITGMVGDGAMHREMILSKPALRASFQNSSDGQNVAIHEFAHLIDKADGATDGVPEYLLTRPYVLPWIKIMHQTMQEIIESEKTDINPYAAASDSEFFAVVSEYFFEKPHELQAHHPELYAMLERMFRAPANKPTKSL
ncbi:MAG TPA: M90 family metallopeptidase [Candidatus Kapabacteria bacterium]|nr:M90 family metallopeptidase [Candidatus Kapabacteria bacterium]